MSRSCRVTRFEQSSLELMAPKSPKRPTPSHQISTMETNAVIQLPPWSLAAALRERTSTREAGRQTSPPPWTMDDKIDLSWLLHPLSVSAEAHND